MYVWLVMLGRTKYTPEPLVPECNLLRLILPLKSYKSKDTDQVPAKLIEAGGEKLRFEIHKLINYISNKDELPPQWKESIIVPI
jgi:hypothetical protein